MRPIQALIVHWWTECVLFSIYCQVPCLSTTTVFNLELRYVIERVGKRFSLNVTNLCSDCPLLNIECLLFSHTVSRKDLSKTFLTLVWILIERPYKWRNQFQVDLTVFKASDLRTLLYPRCSEDQTQLGDLWSGMKVKILLCLLENSRFVLSSTLTFGYAIVYFFLKKVISQFKETAIRVQIALTVLTGYFCCRKKLIF